MSVRRLSRKEEDELAKLKHEDFQLAFLALLTARGIKPASRWEKPVNTEGIEALENLGLRVRSIRRTTRSGKDVHETVFSCSEDRLEEYANRFNGKPVDKKAATQRFEGLFFGYPRCCIEAFIHEPYAPNHLEKEAQSRIFHWACPGCKKTPPLLEAYKGYHRLLIRL
jgi:hypothetical protein